ncbi:MAG TPA: ABATE domain-containing protein [Edaphobacter sp.]
MPTPKPATLNQVPNFLFLGDDPAMDLLNTVARPANEIIDLWQSDADVLGWLSLTGLLQADEIPSLRAGSLLESAHDLREIVRTIILQRKKRRQADLAPLNAFLAQASSFTRLTKSPAGPLELKRRYNARSPEQVLAALAESAAAFIATADFDLVRPCEGEGCILWFYDRTKSHRRRWCSMEVCGNRHKVAAYRYRNA